MGGQTLLSRQAIESINSTAENKQHEKKNQMI